MEDEELYYTPADIARHFRISLHAVYKLIRSGALRSVELSSAENDKSGRRFYRIKQGWLDEFVERRSSRAARRMASEPPPRPRRSTRTNRNPPKDWFPQ